MLDYTQYAFATPPDIFDPIPTVADYIDQYRVNNEAWYSRWAWPHGPNPDIPETQIWGSRPTSFERRAPYEEPPPSETEIPADVLPPIIEEAYGGGSGDNTVRPEDRPVGALVRDVESMSIPDLIAEREALLGPMGYAGSVASAVIPGGIPFLPGAMSRRGVDERVVDIDAERLFRAPQASNLPTLFVTPEVSPPPAIEPPPEDFGGGPVYPVGPTGPRPVPVPERVPWGTVFRDGKPVTVYRDLGTGLSSGRGYGGSSSDRDRQRDTYQGGEVGAGGWAGAGGL